MTGRSAGRPHNPVSRDALLSVAREVFAEHGYGAASLSVIAHRAGLGKASLLHHFASKEALYVETVSEMVRNLHTHVTAAGVPTGTFVERLDRLGQAVVGYLGAHPPVARLLLRELVDGGPFLRGPGAQAVRATLDTIVAFLGQGLVGKALHPDAARHLAFSIIGAHLFYFAAPGLASQILGRDVFEAQLVDQRAQAIRAQVRRMVGVD